MSTLRVRSLDPIDLSAYASHQAREGSAAQQDPSRGDDLPLAASAYAPKRARGFSGPEALESASPSLQVQAVHLDAAAGDDGPPLPRFLVAGRSDIRSESENHPDDLGDSDHAEDAPGTVPDSQGSGEDGHDLQRAAGTADAAGHAVDLDTPSLQPTDTAAGAEQEHSSAEHGHDFGGNDLERLEASLRWLQRTKSMSRLPRATDLGFAAGVSACRCAGPAL